MGAFILGACIGLVVAVVENICREAWLTVVYSPKRFSQVNMGMVPITIGSGSNDTVRVEGVPIAGTQFKLERGIIRCISYGRSFEVLPGSRHTIGNIDVVVCTPEYPYLGGPQIGSGRGVPSPGQQRPSVPSPFSNPMPSSSSAPSPFSNPMPSNPTTSSPSASPTPTPADRDIGGLPVAPSKPSSPTLSVADNSSREGKSIPLPTRKRG